MKITLEDKLRQYQKPYITDGELEVLLNGASSDSRYSKVKRLLAQGKLQHIRRGLYGLSETLGYATKAHPFELAQHIYAPSYISLASALAYHGLIPEAVYSVTCVSTKRSKEFHTSNGVFSYVHLPCENFYCEVDLISESSGQFMMAKPWKAICDYVYCYKKDWQTLEPLQESLRMNQSELPCLSERDAEILMDFYQHKRLTHFLQSIRREMKYEY